EPAGMAETGPVDCASPRSKGHIMRLVLPGAGREQEVECRYTSTGSRMVGSERSSSWPLPFSRLPSIDAVNEQDSSGLIPALRPLILPDDIHDVLSRVFVPTLVRQLITLLNLNWRQIAATHPHLKFVLHCVIVWCPAQPASRHEAGIAHQSELSQ